jgi:hypothetical protein
MTPMTQAYWQTVERQLADDIWHALFQHYVCRVVIYPRPGAVL